MNKQLASNTSQLINSPKEQQTALIVGATGLIGKHLLQQLLASPNYIKVVALTRRPLNITHHKLEALIINFAQLDDELLKHANNTGIKSVKHVFCTLGSTINKAGSRHAFYQVDHDYPLALAKYFHQHGASLFALVSAVGANKNSRVFYNRVKGEVEQSIASINYQYLGIFRPSMLLGHRQESRLAEQLGSAFMKVFAIFIAKKYRAIQAEKVATAMLAFADKPLQSINIMESDQLQNH